MKPVELEIFLQDGLTPGLKSAGKAVGRFSSDSKKQLRDVTEAIKVQRGIVSGLEKECRKLEKSLKSAAPGAAWMEAKSKLSALRSELDAEKAGLEELTNQQRQLKIESENAGQSLRQQLRNVREEISTLLLAYRSLTDAEKQTAQGRELARHIDELTEKAGELNDALVDTSQAITNAASDTRAFDQLAGGMQLVVDGFGLATAGAQALGLSEADLVEVQTQLQTALVASNALTSMQVNLQKQSALMQGINVIQTKAAATAETIRTWAVGRGVIATKAATVAQAAFNAVARANPYVLLAAAVLGVVGALYALSAGNKAAKKAEEERQAQLERTRQAQEDFANKVASSAAEQIASFIKMKKAWEGLGDSFDKKRRFIHETRKAWRELGKEIHSVNEAEDIFKNHTGDVIDAIVKRALVKGYQDIISEQGAELAGKLVTLNQHDEQRIAPGAVYNARDRRKHGYVAPALGEYQMGFMNSKAAREAGSSLYVGNGRQGGWHETYFTERGADLANAYVLLRQTHDSGELRDLSEADMIKQAYEERIRGIIELSETTNRELQDIMESIPGLTVDPEKPNNTPTQGGRLEEARREADELRKFRWQNEQDEINQMAEGAERRRRQIALDHEKQLAEIEKMRSGFVAVNEEAGTTGLNLAGLTEEQQTEIDRANRIAVESRDRALQDMYRAEAQHMSDYLKEYGTFQQRRTAIAEEYDRKIAEASDQWSRKSLEREKAGALQNLEIEAIKQSIDWGSVFGDFGTLFRDQLEPTIAKLRAITKTEEFKNTNLEDKQTLYELISKLEQANASWDSNIFATLGNDLTEYQTALREYMAAQEEERVATETLAQAREKLAAAEASGDNTEIAAATRSVTVATNSLTAASEHVADFGVQVQDASSKLQTSTATVNNMFNSLASNLAGLKSGSLKGVGESLMGLDKLFNNSGVTNVVGGALAKGMSKLLGNSAIGKSVAEALGNSGLLGQIISAILSILDILKDGLGALVSSLLDTILGAVSGILENLLNGQMFVQIGESLVKGIGGILDAITFGGFSSWFGSGDSDKTLARDIEYLTTSNKDLQKAIENLTDKLNEGSVADAQDVYNRQKALLEQSMSNTQQMMQREGAAWTNGFLGIGGHHSSNYKINKGMSGNDWARISSIVGRRIDNAGAFFGMSSEEMLKVFNEANDLYSKIKSLADDGYKNAAQYMDTYIDYCRQMEELQDALREKLTGMSFSSLRDNFKSQLLDMESDAESFSENLDEMLFGTIVESLMSDKYTELLKEWYKKLADAMADDGRLDDRELAELRRVYKNIVDSAIADRDAIADAIGYNPEDSGSGQSGRAGSFNAMSQDQGTKLEGLFVSVQGHVANIDTVVENVAEKMNMAEGYLSRIADNTESSAASAGEIKEMITKIIRDGIKTL